jgi:hypothetical protein
MHKLRETGLHPCSFYASSRRNCDSRSKRDSGMTTWIEETIHTPVEPCNFVTTVLNGASLHALPSSRAGLYSHYTAGGSIE